MCYLVLLNNFNVEKKHVCVFWVLLFNEIIYNNMGMKVIDQDINCVRYFKNGHGSD